MILGAPETGKTSIVRQFLYDQFSTRHVETMDDMYRGEFEAANGKTINFDIEDVGAAYIYEFPSMKSVSLASADAFILVFSLDRADTWYEVSKLRDMVRDAKVRTNSFFIENRRKSRNSVVPKIYNFLPPPFIFVVVIHTTTSKTKCQN